MRDQRFVTVRRGGSLSLQHHQLLIVWACTCAEHLLPLLGEADLDVRLTTALATARAWASGQATMTEARKAAVAAHTIAREAAAREAVNPVAVALARAVGHAVATAHMADHSLSSALYGLKAVEAAGESVTGRSVSIEREWQLQQLPEEIRALVLSALSGLKFSAFST